MKANRLLPRFVIAASLFMGLVLFLIVSPILVAAQSGYIEQVQTGTATSYAYLPIIFSSVVETGVATLIQHSGTFVTTSVYSFLGFGLMLGVVALLMPFKNQEDID